MKLTRSFLIVASIFMMIGVPSTTRGDVVTDWNQIGITAMVSAGRGQAPMYPDLAYEHIAIYDAVNAIDLSDLFDAGAVWKKP